MKSSPHCCVRFLRPSMKKAFEKFDLTGKVGLITGAAGLLGVEHAAALLESGATVVLTDVSEESLASARELLSHHGVNSSNILTRVMDVRLQSAIRNVDHELRKSGHRVDILINNAAIDPKVKSDQNTLEVSRLETFSLEQW